MPAPQPEEIYENTKEEGRRRLSRPPLELAATALVGGFDVAVGVVAYAIAARTIHGGGHELLAALAFGIGFVFIVVGRSELFTENFLIPVAGLQPRSGKSWFKLGELWIVALVVNVIGGAIVAVIVTSRDVLPAGSDHVFLQLANHIDGRSTLPAFLSALIAGALIALGSFNHAIVGAVEMILGMRVGAPIDTAQFLGNLGTAVAGNLVGGLMFVTFVRSVQAAEGARG